MRKYFQQIVVVQLSGARHQCSLFVDRVTRHMHGDWMCLLNEISQFNSGLQIQSLE